MEEPGAGGGDAEGENDALSGWDAVGEFGDVGCRDYGVILKGAAGGVVGGVGRGVAELYMLALIFAVDRVSAAREWMGLTL